MSELQWCFEVAERVQVYASREQGFIASRSMKTNARYGDEEECYLVQLDSGERREYFGSQLENP